MNMPAWLRLLVVPAMVAACTRGADAPPASQAPVVPTSAQTVAPAATPATTPAPVASVADPGSCARSRELPPAPIAPNAADASRPFDAGEGYLQLRAAKEGLGEASFCGKVERIDPTRDAKRVVLTGSAPELERSFELRLPSKLALPFGVGDELVVALRSRTIAIHRVLEGRILDGSGRLLVGFSHDGDIEFAPGWSVDMGGVASTGRPHMPGGAQRQERDLLLARGGVVARIRGGAWRQLDAGDATWAVSGNAVDWTQGPRPPDASAYRQFSVVRLRANAH